MGSFSRLFFVIFFSTLIGCSHVFPTQKAAIATAHPLATQAGLDILKQGGNAFDAAVAVSAVLAVVEPTGSGLGGGGFWLLHRASDQYQVMIDGREVAPGAADRDMYIGPDGQHDKAASLDGPLAAGIPGLPAALDHISHFYGRLSLQQTLAPAIQHAKSGFTLSDHYRTLATFRLKALQASPAASAIFLNNDLVPNTDHILVQTDLAYTLTQLAQHGRDGFYQGDIAQHLLKGVSESGGIWTQADLDHYQVIERDVIKSQYQGYQISSAALPSSGGIVLTQILNQLTYLPLAESDEPQQRHLIVEAMRRAYFDRSQYLGDSDFVSIPPHLISPDYAQTLASEIDIDLASDNAALIDSSSKGEDTTHFAIIDQYGNRVAATLSINYPFGSGFVAPGTGVLLNDEMDDFSSQIGSANGYGLVGNEANAIAPFKRPLSSMTPTFIENDDRLMVIGTPGGSRIITMVLLGLLDFIEGDDAETIVSAPRYHHQYLPNVIQLESIGFSDKEQQALVDYGHDIKVLSRQYGNMQVIIFDKETGQLDAASDPRGEGSAIVSPLPRLMP
ncbi:MAG: gamma-glutamyltransferase [Piscirickettsiaceae bacterium]|nr:gamma-glutamyltransferase [Piscirickettsiaceae bacterium]